MAFCQLTRIAALRVNTNVNHCEYERKLYYRPHANRGLTNQDDREHQPLVFMHGPACAIAPPRRPAGGGANPINPAAVCLLCGGACMGVFLRPTQHGAGACRHSHLNTLVKVTGVVTRRTGVYPQMSVLFFICRTCGNQIGPLMQSGEAEFEVKPQQCTHCEGRGPFDVDQHHTVYRNYQKITLQVRARAGSGRRRPGRAAVRDESILGGRGGWHACALGAAVLPVDAADWVAGFWLRGRARVHMDRPHACRSSRAPVEGGPSVVHVRAGVARAMLMRLGRPADVPSTRRRLVTRRRRAGTRWVGGSIPT